MQKIFIYTFLLLFSAPLFAAGIEHIDNKELQDLINQGVPVIDVRATSEWEKTGVIENSHLIMFYDEQGKYDLEKWLSDVGDVASKDKPVVLICHRGVRSHQLAKYLTKVAGYETVYNHKKGISHWIKKDHPVVAPIIETKIPSE